MNAQRSVSISQAQTHLNALAAACVIPYTESLPLMHCVGRILAQDVIAPIAVPAHDNSAMDGYAFHSSAFNRCNDGDGVVALAVVGKALAGKPWTGQLGADQCVHITTGAVMPLGADTVVPSEMVLPSVHSSNVSVQNAPNENASGENANRIRFPHKSLFAGDNRRKAGEDIPLGSVALTQGSVLSSAALGLLASLGMAQATVYQRLRVAYFSTGDEILSFGDAPREGAIYDSNRYTVLALLERLGVQTIDLGVVPDDPLQLEAVFRHACTVADAIITSGGVSVGEADHTKAIMRKLGEVEFWRIAMRPGRPMAVGSLPRAQGGSAILFGLPGNPVAVMVTFLALVRPALLQMMGAKSAPQLCLQAKSQEVIRKKAGRTEYQRGIVSVQKDGQLVVRTTGQQGSGVLSSMVQANGLIVLDHDKGDVSVGDSLNVMMLEALL